MPNVTTNYYEGYKEILQEVISLPTAPLYEYLVVDYIKNFLEKREIFWLEDSYGNLVVEYQKGPSVPAIGFVAHLDHPGFELVDVQKECAKLEFLGGSAPPQKGDVLILFQNNRTYTLKVKETILDSIPKSVLAYTPEKSIQPFGFAMHDLAPFSQQEDMIYSRAIDDLAGCAGLLCVLETLIQKNLDAHVYILFTRAEEIGFIGACGLAMSGLLPQGMPLVSLEASRKLSGAEQGKGVVIRLGDRKSIFAPNTTAFLISLAEEIREKNSTFCFQKRVMDGGTCEASMFYSFGYPSSGVAIPLGNYHNHGENSQVAPENIHIQDWYAMIALLIRAATHTERLIGWEQLQRAYFLKRFQKYRKRIVENRLAIKSNSHSYSQKELDS